MRSQAYYASVIAYVGTDLSCAGFFLIWRKMHFIVCECLSHTFQALVKATWNLLHNATPIPLYELWMMCVWKRGVPPYASLPVCESAISARTVSITCFHVCTKTKSGYRSSILKGTASNYLQWKIALRYAVLCLENTFVSFCSCSLNFDPTASYT